MTEKEIIAKNKELVKEYPFIAYKEYDFDNDVYYIPKDYDYKYTWLDGLPEGWVKAFGEDLCRELKEALDEYNYTDKFIIVQTKEKFGEMRIYHNGRPVGSKVEEVIDKYARISERTCCKCGKPATKISLGWICPWCDECAEKINDNFVDINEWFEDEDD